MAGQVADPVAAQLGLTLVAPPSEPDPVASQLGLTPVQPRPAPMEAHGVTDPASVKVTGPGVPAGLRIPGNIDLYKQPEVKNADGSTSTVDSISIGNDQGEVLIPRVTPDGRHLTSDQAVKEYEKTGRHLGIFDTPAAATTYAQQLHNDYAGGKYKAPATAHIAPETPGDRLESRLREGKQSLEQLWGWLSTSPLTGPAHDAGEQEIVKQLAEGQKMTPQAARSTAQATGFIAGAMEGAAGLVTPLNVGLGVAGNLSTILTGRITQLAQDAQWLRDAVRAGGPVPGLPASAAGADTAAQQLAETMDRLQKLEALRSSIAAGQGVVGAGFTTEGAYHAITGPTLGDRAQGVAEMAGGAAMALQGAQTAKQPLRVTEAVTDELNRRPPVNVTPTEPRPPETPPPAAGEAPGPPQPPAPSAPSAPLRELPTRSATTVAVESLPTPRAVPDPVADQLGLTPVTVPTERVVEDLRAARAAGDTPAEQTAIAELTRRGESIPETGSSALPDTQVAPIDASTGGNASVSTEKPAQAPETRSYASTQIEMPPEIATATKALADSIDESDLAEQGRETDPHVTVKYGIHADDVAPIRAALKDEPPITVRLGTTSTFPDSGHGEVLKVDVDSPDLHRLNAKIAKAVETTDTHPEYAPHVTLGYLKPGTGQKYVGRDDLKDKTAVIDTVTFSPKDGSPVTIKLGGQSKAAVQESIPASGQSESKYKPGNPFGEKAMRARAKADRLGGPTARDKAMEQAFPLGGGYGRPGAAKRMDATVNRSVAFVEADREAKYLAAQAEAFDQGKINAQGRRISPDSQARSEKREGLRERQDERVAAAKAELGDRPKWMVTADVWADSTRTLGGSGRDLVKYGHREAVEQAIAEGHAIPENVLADYPDLKPGLRVVSSATLPEADAPEEVRRPPTRARSGQPGPQSQGSDPAGDAAKAKRAELRQHARERQAEYQSALASAPDDVVHELVQQATRGGYAGDEDTLRTELRHRLALISELDEEFASSGHNPHALLKAIAGYGGLSIKKESKLKAELRDLAQLGSRGTSAKGAAFGRLGGVNGVFNQHGLSLDLMLSSLQQDAKFGHLETLQDLHDAIDEAGRAPSAEGHAADRLKESLGERWWDRIKPVASTSFEDDLAELRGDDEEGDTSFDTSDFEPQDDVLDTGERQARLPEAGSVRDRDVKTPEFEASFSLSGEAATTKAAEPSLFGEEKPKFAKRDDAAFARWFGRSKVVTANGDPLVVYHSTPYDFTEFDFGDQIGPHFGTLSAATDRAKKTGGMTVDVQVEKSPDSPLWEVWREGDLHGEYETKAEAERIAKPLRKRQAMAVYLSIKNPLHTRDFGVWDGFGGLLGALQDHLTPEEADTAWSAYQQSDRAGWDALREALGKEYDGIVYENDVEDPGSLSYIPFSPGQIKSATANRGTYDASRADIRFSKREPAPVFYSALTRAAEQLPQAKGSPDQMIAMLQKAKGVKPDEIHWSGVVPWIQGLNRPVTKTEIVDYLKANELHVSESVHADDNKHKDKGLSTKFGNYVLPGGESYKELLITLPVPLTTDQIRPDAKALAEHKGEWDALVKRLDTLEYGTREYDATQSEMDALHAKGVRETALRMPRLQRQDPFTSGHFDEPNVVAHLRFDDRTDVDGKKVLFVEEVQSDWHQKGRKHGYRPEFDPHKLDVLMEVQAKAREQANKASQEVRDLLDNTDLLGYDTPSEAMRYLRDAANDWKETNDWRGMDTSELFPAVDEMRTSWETYGRANAALEAYRDEGHQPPDAPFKTTWPELAMKRAVRYAAEHGYERIAWTTGEQQNARYDLSKIIDTVTWVDWPANGKDAGVLRAYKDGKKIIGEQTITKDKIEDFVGKDIAERLLAQTPDKRSGQRELSGLDLKVGGEGMKGFYDKILPSFMNKFGKPFGAKVSDVVIDVTSPGSGGFRYEGPPAPAGDLIHLVNEHTEVVGQPLHERARDLGGRIVQARKTTTVHALDVTDAMRDSVMEGLPLFATQDGERPAFDKEQIALLKSTYAGVSTVEMPGRSKPVAVLDAGGRLTAKELKTLTSDPDVQRVAVASLKVLDEVLGYMLGEAKAGVERTGLVFDDRTYGVYVPKPGESRGPAQKASIFLNLFEPMLPRTTPYEAARMMVQTAVHEALHWHVPMDGPEFEEQLAAALTKIGPGYFDHATGRIMEAYADVDDQARYRAGLREVLSLYSESRRRQEVTPDALSRSGRRAERSPDEQNAGDKPPPDLRRGRGKVVTRAELKALAEKRSTSVAHERERAIDAGYTIQDEGLLGPAVERVAGAVKQDQQLVLSVLAPQKIGVAPIAAGKIRAHTSANDQRKARVSRSLEDDRAEMDRWSEHESADFIDVMEGTKSPDTLPSDRQDTAKQYRGILNQWRALLVDKDLLQSYLENYWPHEWKKQSLEGKAIKKFFGRRPAQGPESYRKQRTIPTFRQGVAFGLEPVTWNPAEMLQRKVFEMSQSVKGRDLHSDLMESGLYAYVPVGKERPEAISGWTRVPEYALGVKYGPRDEKTFGRVIVGHYYAPSEVVRLIENHLSPGLWGRSALFDAYKTMGNLSTQFILGWSSFHLWLTGLESMISKSSVALEHLSRGEFANAGKLAVQVGPQGIVRDLFRGYKAIQAFYAHDGDANDVTGMIGQIIQAGGGFGWSGIEHENAPAKFMKDIRGLLGAVQRGELGTATGKAGKAVLHGALAAFEAPTSLIMNHWVPYLKVSAFLDMANLEMTRLGPEATLDEYREVLGKAWDAVDDRFGQLRYDNLFWNNTLKQVATGGLLSVGWQVGSLRHGLGALGQGKRLVQNVKALAGGGGRGKPPGPSGLSHRGDWFGPEGVIPPAGRIVQPWLQRNAAWLFSGAVMVGILGAIYQKLQTGKDPESVKDLFYPRNGKVDANGREERDAPISYAKDYYSWFKHPVTTATHKLKPFLSMLADVVENEDFFGTEIRNEDDPAVQQVRDVLLYWLQRNSPISYGNALHRAGDGATKSELFKEWLKVQAVPFSPASAEIERSAAENYLHSLMPPMHRTKAQADHAQSVRELRQGLSEKDPEAMKKAAAAGLSDKSRRAAITSVRLGPLASAFNRATWTQAVRAYELATPEERRILKPRLLVKFGNAMENSASIDERKRFIDDRKTALARPVAAIQ